MPAEKVVLVTGASRGLGRDLAGALLRAGHRPVAAMRSVSDRNADAAGRLAAEGVAVVEIDVTDEASVDRGVADALERFERIDVLVNNAGFGVSGPLEAVTPGDLTALFETNVLGAHRMVRAVLPSMRERVDGLLVHVSSGAGRFALPGSGAYAASKWALEAIGETLRYELAPLGIDSVLVEPGMYVTEFDAAVRTASGTDRLAPYAYMREIRRTEPAPPGDASEVSATVVRLIEMPRGTRPARVSVRPGGDDIIDALNDEQSVVARRLLERFDSEAYRANGTG